MEEIREQLHRVVVGPITDQTKQQGEDLRRELEHIYSDEDLYWRQRSNVQWAREGDRNTSFFHSAATKRKTNNTITGLFNEMGEWLRRG